MKKNRNSFFSESQMNFQGYNSNMGMMAANQPYQSANAYNAYYAGPVPNAGVAPTDLESRLAKIERQITRLEHRISKLETTNTYVTDDIDSNTTNMYML